MARTLKGKPWEKSMFDGVVGNDWKRFVPTEDEVNAEVDRVLNRR